MDLNTFYRKAFCAYCEDRIWGIGRQGFKCISCKVLIHKKCHQSTQIKCDPNSPWLSRSSSRNGSGSGESTGACKSNTVTPVLSRKNNKIHIGTVDKSERRADLACTDEQSARSSTNKEVADIVAGSFKTISIDNFNLLRVIGRGNFSKVLMVELKTTGRLYAMKVVKKELVMEDEDIEWVQIEKNVFETASNHPFLVGLHSCFQTPSRLFYVIELVQGGDLMYHMQNKKKLPEEHARFYSAEISLALNFLHENGIIFRDLKLDNVLMDCDGHIKLTDYGLCKQGVKKGDKTSTFCGTPNYMAPEILSEQDYSFSVDWWALGILLFEMMAGRGPFFTENFEEKDEDFLFQVILTKTIRPPRSLSVKAGKIITGFLNKNPKERLGCNSEYGFREIIEHPFFSSIDWEALEQKQINPPYLPTLQDERDLVNFPDEFTKEPVQFTPDGGNIKDIDQSEFEGFEYVNPLLMSAEEVV